jgi:glucose-1-phosphate thymidylyltransferase
MQDAATYVRVIEQRQGLKIGCIEEIAWRQGWIDDGELALIASSYENSDYGNYLKRLI